MAYLDRREERDPDVKKALAKKKANDIGGAIKLYQKALDRKPTMALPHLELGILFDDKKKDYVRAIYHYQRYLELRPNAEEKKIEIVKRLIDIAEMSFAASLPDRPSSAIRQIAALKKENELLKQKFEDFGVISHPAGTPKANPKKNGSDKKTNPGRRSRPVAPDDGHPKPPVDKYLVQSGDNLSSIARTMYNDPDKWELIYKANRNTLSSPSALKIGQTLIIPQ